MAAEFELWIFCADPLVIRQAVAGGAAGVIVDWESRGKRERQAGADTQIAPATRDELRRVRDSTGAPVVCRLNPFGPGTAQEAEAALECGADELWLSMVDNPEQVAELGRVVGGRAKVGMMLETVSAVLRHAEFANVGLSHVYVGLQDLTIALGRQNVLVPLADGTVDGIRRTFVDPFGFGGLTLPDRGDPIPSRLIIGEMVRLRSTFTVLRRSFLRDVGSDGITDGVHAVRMAYEQALRRDPAAAERDHREFRELVFRWHATRRLP